MKINFASPIKYPIMFGKYESGIVKSGLIAEYRFDEGKGQTLKDFSGYSNDGLITNGVWSIHGISCDGDDYANLDGILSDPNSLTVSAVFKRSSSVNSEVLFGHRSDAYKFIQLTSYSDSEVRFQMRTNTANLTVVSATGVDTVNNYICATGVFNKSKNLHKIFIGKSLISTDTTIFSESFLATKQTIGATDTGSGYVAFFSGTIASMLLYNRDLDSSEIEINYINLKQSLYMRGIKI